MTYPYFRDWCTNILGENGKNEINLKVLEQDFSYPHRVLNILYDVYQEYSSKLTKNIFWSHAYGNLPIPLPPKFFVVP